MWERPKRGARMPGACSDPTCQAWCWICGVLTVGFLGLRIQKNCLVQSQAPFYQALALELVHFWKTSQRLNRGQGAFSSSWVQAGLRAGSRSPAVIWCCAGTGLGCASSLQLFLPRLMGHRGSVLRGVSCSAPALLGRATRSYSWLVGRKKSWYQLIDEGDICFITVLASFAADLLLSGLLVVN